MRRVFQSTPLLLPTALLIVTVLIAAAGLGGRWFGDADIREQETLLGRDAHVAAATLANDLADGREREAANTLELLRDAEVLPGSVLMDLTLPGRPVREILRELRELAPAMPVVLTSGFLRQSSAMDELPDLPFLAKPYSPEQLADAIRAALEGAPSRAT